MSHSYLYKDLFSHPDFLFHWQIFFHLFHPNCQYYWIRMTSCKQYYLHENSFFLFLFVCSRPRKINSKEIFSFKGLLMRKILWYHFMWEKEQIKNYWFRLMFFYTLYAEGKNSWFSNVNLNKSLKCLYYLLHYYTVFSVRNVLMRTINVK